MIDFHNHLMPGVDDGAATDAEALAGVGALCAQGVTTIITTPHVAGSLSENPVALNERLSELDEGWNRLLAAVAGRYPQLDLRRGAEVMLDTPDPVLADTRLRLAGGRCVLVEFPFMMVPPQSARVIAHVVTQGVQPIIAHPERYSNFAPDLRLAFDWREHGALLQLNAGSLTGRYGQHAKTNAFALLQRGLADFVCSDYHSRGRPALASAHQYLVTLKASDQAELLMKVNPRRLFDGQEPIPVPPLRSEASFIARVKRWLT